MNVLASPHPATPSNLVRGPADGQCFLLDGISWQQYVAISDALPDRPALRITYDRGRLEFMTTSQLHERYKVWFGRFFDVLLEEAGIDAVPAGHSTFRREDLDRGVEPDNTYWIAHEQPMRTVAWWDARRDPPPDLVLEIEISRRIINRLPILAAMGVPEVWCFDGTAIRVYVLGSDGSYQIVARSPTFPTVELDGIVPFFHRTDREGSTVVMRDFRAWVRQQLATNP